MVDLTGRCLCGAVRWRYVGAPGRNLICHCEDCQRATSAPFAAFIGMRPSGLTFTGEITDYESSPGSFRAFCPACGTRLSFRSEKWPDELHVHAATLDNPGDYRPDAQVVMRSRQKWLDHLDGLPAFDGFQVDPRAGD